jgi:hypothetical protein
LYPIRVKDCKYRRVCQLKGFGCIHQTKTVELLECFTSGSLATKAPLNGQKTQILISFCDKRLCSK